MIKRLATGGLGDEETEGLGGPSLKSLENPLLEDCAPSAPYDDGMDEGRNGDDSMEGRRYYRNPGGDTTGVLSGVNEVKSWRLRQHCEWPLQIVVRYTIF
jgi:hypothetical protein